MPAAADSWYHEKEPARLHAAVAAARQQAACWRRLDPAIPLPPFTLRLQGNDAIHGALRGGLPGASAG